MVQQKNKKKSMNVTNKNNITAGIKHLPNFVQNWKEIKIKYILLQFCCKTEQNLQNSKKNGFT